MNETPNLTPDAGTDPLRELLARVAAGEVGPDEAARLLDEDPTAPTHDRSSDLPAFPSGSVTAVMIKAGGVKLTVVADPTVDTLVADGPHALRQDGPTLVLEAPGADGWKTQAAAEVPRLGAQRGLDRRPRREGPRAGQPRRCRCRSTRRPARWRSWAPARRSPSAAAPRR